MKKIYAPWRESYIKNTAQKPNEKRKNIDCIFCHQLNENDDEKFFILKRYKHCFTMMNLYPYNEGHLLVIPITHKKDLDSLASEERHELIDCVNIGINAVQKVLKPHGFNLGVNLGSAGGAGIPSHVHFHVLPRWEGDTNFMPTIGETKILSSDLKELYKKLKKEF